MLKKVVLMAVAAVVVVAGGVFVYPVEARENVNYWYIKDFHTEIVVNNDSSLLITERIVADCGNAPDKHGIFRVLPTQSKTVDGQIFKTPIKLLAISDFDGVPLKYSTQRDQFKHTITWKIGDANKTVKGVNYYEIKYLVKNAIRFGDPAFDEFYWNVLGNFWDLQIDNFSATVLFPVEVDKADVEIDYYVGQLLSQSKEGAKYFWKNENTLMIQTTRTMAAGEGVTLSATFPKGIFAPYVSGIFEKYGALLVFLIPLFVFAVAYSLWKKHGKDPRVDKAIMPEYDPPAGLSPIQLGGVMNVGKFKEAWLSAALINFAVKGLLKIEEIEVKKFIGSKTDYKFVKLSSFESPSTGSGQALGMTKGIEREGKGVAGCPAEKELYAKFFGDKTEVLLSELQHKFYKEIPGITVVAKQDLIANGWLVGGGLTRLGLMMFFAFLAWIGAVYLGKFYLPLSLALGLSGFILFIFSLYMPKKTPAGAELDWQGKGFKLFMETAEKYRQQFYEKENIFEKLLPYAMVFGITKQWIAKTREIFGEDYFKTYHPMWFTGAALTSFNADSFTAKMSEVSSAIASNVGTSSGAGGHGGSGGGGGGGGGGGW